MYFTQIRGARAGPFLLSAQHVGQILPSKVASATASHEVASGRAFARETMPPVKVVIRGGGGGGGGAAMPTAKVAIKCENCLEKKLERTETEEGFAWVCSRFKR